MYKHILIPTDGSKLSKAASEAGVRLAKALGARVTAFFAAPPATPIVFKGLMPVGYQPPEAHEESIRKAAQSYLGAVEKAAQAAGVLCEVMSATSDYPAEAIVAAAKKRRCDLIFMASHGRRGVRRESLLGGETQKVLAQSAIAVLVHRRFSANVAGPLPARNLHVNAERISPMKKPAKKKKPPRVPGREPGKRRRRGPMDPPRRGHPR